MIEIIPGYDMIISFKITCVNLIKKEDKRCQISFRIKRVLARILLKICANLVEYLKNIIFSETFLSRHKQSQQNFTRNRCLPFSTMIFFLMNLIKGSLQDELDYFFKAIDNLDVAVRSVTKSAFCRARKKLKYQAFIELSQKLISFFYENFCCRTWHSFRLLAIDASTIKVPKIEEIVNHFGVLNPAKGESCPLARISHLFDILNKVTIDAIISPIKQGERILAAKHIQNIGIKDLLLLDRGYPAYWLFALILSKGSNFCARITIEHWKIIRQFYHSGRKEKVISISPSPSSIKLCQEMGLPIKPLKLRVVRVELETGETQILITSLLDKNTYPQDIFKELYHKRWLIEEDYKAMKCRVEVENFSGKSVESVYQDFHAKIFTMNLTAAIAHPCREIIEQESRQKIYQYQTNLTQAFSKMKDAVVLLFHRFNILELISKLHKLFIKTVEPIRPKRKYPRKKGIKRKGFDPCYKPVR